jgi:hypothetical protein
MMLFPPFQWLINKQTQTFKEENGYFSLVCPGLFINLKRVSNSLPLFILQITMLIDLVNVHGLRADIFMNDENVIEPLHGPERY